jgi:hypothetical protein
VSLYAGITANLQDLRDMDVDATPQRVISVKYVLAKGDMDSSSVTEV